MSPPELNVVPVTGTTIKYLNRCQVIDRGWPNATDRRERQAQLTRDEILAAARRLFAERGYTRTSVRDIAEAAGVSAQTVYDSIGSKQALVARLNDLIDEEAGIAAIVEAGGGSGDPGRGRRHVGRVTRSILEHCGDIVRALVTGAAAEPDLPRRSPRAIGATSGARRQIVGRLDRARRPRPGLDPEAAVGTMSRGLRHDVRAGAAGRLRLVARPDRGVDGRDHLPGCSSVTRQR